MHCTTSRPNEWARDGSGSLNSPLLKSQSFIWFRNARYTKKQSNGLESFNFLSTNKTYIARKQTGLVVVGYGPSVRYHTINCQCATVPKYRTRSSFASTNDVRTSCMLIRSVRSLCICNSMQWFKRCWDIVWRKYVLMRLIVENDLSAVADVIGTVM